MTSPVRLGVSPAAASTPTGVFNQRFEALFPAPPCWSPGLHGLICSPTVLPGLSVRKCGAARSASCHTACPVRSTIRHLSGSGHLAVSSESPGCPSLPLLSVWVNVSSLSPWLPDFHTVRFSVSSGCFLFLKCCPSFGYVRRCSMSTYASIFDISFYYIEIYLFMNQTKVFWGASDGD